MQFSRHMDAPLLESLRIGSHELLTDEALQLEEFAPASLDDLDSLDMLKRYDTKFVLPESMLTDVLHAFKDDYCILDINGYRNFQYINLYFDTADHLMYKQHHNGKLNRAKIRYRHYNETGDYFFEIKRSTNDKRTIKDRLQTDGIKNFVAGPTAALVYKILGIDHESLQPAIIDSYRRITLINKQIPEKITIDTRLSFSNSCQMTTLPGLMLLEVKQKKVSALTPSIQFLKSNDFHPFSGLSKYCLGVVMTDRNVKYNKFKSVIMLINKIMEDKHGQ